MTLIKFLAIIGAVSIVVGLGLTSFAVILNLRPQETCMVPVSTRRILP